MGPEGPCGAEEDGSSIEAVGPGGGTEPRKAAVGLREQAGTAPGCVGMNGGRGAEGKRPEGAVTERGWLGEAGGRAAAGPGGMLAVHLRAAAP